MNRLKLTNYFIFMLAGLSLILGGCSPSAAPESQVSTDEYTITGLMGENLSIKDAEWIFEIGTDKHITPEEALNTDNRYRVRFNFAYAYNSAGVSYNSIGNPDMFVTDTDGILSMTAAPSEQEYELKKVYAGDKTAGLTLSEAYTVFECENGLEPALNDICYMFEGETTFTGYIVISPEDGLATWEDCIWFYPEPESVGDLPIWFGHWGVDVNPTVIRVGDFAMYTDVYYIDFGSISDYPDLDLSGIPQDGTFVHAEIKLELIRRWYTESATGGFWGNFKNVKFI